MKTTVNASCAQCPEGHTTAPPRTIPSALVTGCRILCRLCPDGHTTEAFPTLIVPILTAWGAPPEPARVVPHHAARLTQ